MLTIGVIVLLVAVFAGRLISERGMRSLTADQKARFLDAFSNYRAYSLLPVIAFVLLTFLVPGKVQFWVLSSGLLLYIVAVSIFSVRKMRSLGLAAGYVRAYTTGQAVQVGGLLFYFALLQGWIP